MRDVTFYRVFLEFLQDVYDAENQIIEALPNLVQHSSHPDLKEALRSHLKETKEQVKRLEAVFSLLGEAPKGKKCVGMKGLLQEGEEAIGKNYKSANLKDYFIIVAAQKVEHYEISTYGSLIALVELSQEAWENKTGWEETCNLLKESLKEEKAADAKLNKIAEGGFFTNGINKQCEKELCEHVVPR